jgi:hypothetical protein
VGMAMSNIKRVQMPLDATFTLVAQYQCMSDTETHSTQPHSDRLSHPVFVET